MCECERGIEARGRRVEGRRWERRVSRGGGILWVVWVRYRGKVAEMPKRKNWNESRLWCVVDLLMSRWREEARSSKSRDEFWRTRDERSVALGKVPLSASLIYRWTPHRAQFPGLKEESVCWYLRVIENIFGINVIAKPHSQLYLANSRV